MTSSVAADGAGRQAAGQGLGQGDHVGHHAEALDRAAGGRADAGLDLVEDEHDAVLLGDVAHRLQVARLRQHHAQVHHGGFHDHAGRLLALVDEVLDAGFHHGSVVERHGGGHVDDGLRDALAVADRLVVVARTDLAPVGHAQADHDVVVMAVVGAEDLHHLVAAGERAGDTDGVHGGLGPGVHEAPLGQLEVLGQMLGHDDGVLGRAARTGCRVRSAS